MRGRIYRTEDVRWEGYRLCLLKGRLLAVIEPDAQWPGVYRARFPNGYVTDIVNITRAKDAAVSLALAWLNAGDREAA